MGKQFADGVVYRKVYGWGYNDLALTSQGGHPLKRLVVKGILWIEEVVDKLDTKHGVQQYEVEEIFENEPYVRFVEKGHRPGENVYAALGETDAGRYLVVFYIHKSDQWALVISAREMSDSERKRYEER